MANIFKTILGIKDKRDTTYQGPRPVGGLAGAEGGKEYYNQIYNRAVGRTDLGFGKDYAEKYANPIVQNMRSGFESYQMPELKSELSASGRRQGSAGSDLIRRAYQEQGLQEGDVFSKLQQRNEDQYRNELNTSISQMGQYANQDANFKNILANFEYGSNQDQVAREDARLESNSKVYKDLMAAAVNMATGIPTMPSSSQSYQTPYSQGMPAGYGANMGNQGYNSFGQFNSPKNLYKQMLPTPRLR